MPKLRIMSIYKERRRTFAAELFRASTELEQFRASLVVRYGKETADAIRQEARWRKGVILGRSDAPKLPKEFSATVKELRRLNHNLTAARKKIRAADCWFRESPGPISVLDTAGLSWSVVNERCANDGRLPVAGVLWLLKTLRTTDQIIPTEEQVLEWAAMGLGPYHLPAKWWQLLRRRRRRLAVLLKTAAMLEEDVQWEFGF